MATQSMQQLFGSFTINTLITINKIIYTD